MAYRVFYVFDDDSTEGLLDELFDTEEEAREAALEGMGNYAYGNETLMLGGHDYCEKQIVDYDIEEESDLED